MRFVAGESVTLFSLLPAKSFNPSCRVFLPDVEVPYKSRAVWHWRAERLGLGSCALWASLLDAAWDSLFCRVRVVQSHGRRCQSISRQPCSMPAWHNVLPLLCDHLGLWEGTSGSTGLGVAPVGTPRLQVSAVLPSQPACSIAFQCYAPGTWKQSLLLENLVLSGPVPSPSAFCRRLVMKRENMEIVFISLSASAG